MKGWRERKRERVYVFRRGARVNWKEREGGKGSREEKFWMSEREVNLRRNASSLRSARGGR